MTINVSHAVGEKEVTTTTAAESIAKESLTPSRAEGRLVSLDAFRGFIMFWIVGGGGLVLGLQALGRNPVTDAIVYELNHTPWQGLRFYDCIWPCFMLMVGMSIPFSVAKRSLTQTNRQMTWHAFERTAVLFLLGSVRQSVRLGSPHLIELSSALQPIAIAYFVAFLLVRKSPRVQAAIGVGILAAYALLLAFVPAPGIPAGTYAVNHNLVTAVDLALLGRAHAEGWGTVLSAIPTISTTILGLLVGELLRSDRPRRTKLNLVGEGGLLCVIIGYAMSPFIPVIMKLWTASYGFLTAGWACLMFMLFYWIIDVRGYKKWTLPFVVIGTNAVFIYMLTSVIPLGHLVGVFTQGVEAELGSFGPLFSALAVLAVEWLILFWMYERKIFIKA